MAHTPTPWHVDNEGIYDANNNLLMYEMDILTGKEMNDQDFIVRAVNAHEILVSALEKVAPYCIADYDLHETVQAALALAKEKP